MTLIDDKTQECVCKRMRIRSGEKKAKDEIRQITMTNYCINNPPKYDTNIKIRKERKSISSLVEFNPLNPELNPICYLLALLGAHHFLHVSRIRVKLLTLGRLMSYIYMEHPFLMFLDHTQRRSTVGRTPLDE